MKLDDALASVANLGIDTAPIIYFIEEHPRYDPLVTKIFQRIAVGTLSGWTSVVTLCEVLVQPLLQGRADLAHQYRNLLLHSSNFNTLPVTAAIAERASDLRARYRLRTPDALQVALALDVGCEAFLCNDNGIRRVTELHVLTLDDLEV